MGIDGGLYGGVASAAWRRHATKNLTTICLPVRKTAVHLQQAPLQAALAHRGFVQQVEGLQAHRTATTDWREIISPVFALLPQRAADIMRRTVDSRDLLARAQPH